MSDKKAVVIERAMVAAIEANETTHDLGGALDTKAVVGRLEL
jgi:hypothetical protein